MSDYSRNTIDNDGNAAWVDELTIIEPEHLDNYEDAHEKAIRRDPSTEARQTIIPEADIRGLVAEAFTAGTKVALHAESTSNGIRDLVGSGAVGNDDHTILVDASGGPAAITLPSATQNPGRVLFIKKVDSSLNDVIADPPGADTVDGDADARVRFQYSTMRLVSNGTDWFLT